MFLAVSVAALPTVISAQRDPLNPHGVLTVTVGCGSCHNTGGWIPTKDPLEFNHDTETGFRLDGKHGGFLQVFSKTDGKRLAEHKLEHLPAFDGLIAANGSLYMVTQHGSVSCYSSSVGEEQ